MSATELIHNEDEATWQEAGTVATDTGAFLIGDPCQAVQLVTGRKHEAPTWADFCDRWNARDKDSVAEFGLRGTIVGGFGGDISAPVYVLRKKDGFVKAALIVFDPAQDEDDDEEVGGQTTPVTPEMAAMEAGVAERMARYAGRGPGMHVTCEAGHVSTYDRAFEIPEKCPQCGAEWTD